MTQREFARFFKEHMGKDKTFKQAQLDVKGFMEAMVKVFAETEEDRIVFPSIGSFVLRTRKERVIKHLFTKENITIPKRRKISFKSTANSEVKINK